MKKWLISFSTLLCFIFIITFKPYDLSEHISVEIYHDGFMIYTRFENFIINPQYANNEVQSLGGGLWAYKFLEGEIFSEVNLKMNFSLTSAQLWYHFRDHTYLDSSYNYPIYYHDEITVKDKLIQFGIEKNVE